jgi:amidohydrolase
MENIKINPEVEELFGELVRLRREIHEYPELLFDLPRTSALVAAYLQELGLEVIRNVGQSGVVGVLRGSGPCILLRADMDCLPLTEVNDVEYKSKLPGRMHACGHDAHTAMLLIAAKVLSQNRAKLAGSVKFMFQPAEEGGHGALRMIEDPVYPILDTEPRVDQVFGIHVSNSHLVGSYQLSDLYMSCMTDFFSILVTGKGGHMSMSTINPVQVAAEMILALQTIVSRNVNNADRAVLSITSFNGGEAENAVPETCRLKGTIRCFTQEVKELILRRIQEICKGVEIRFKCKAEFELIPVYPPIRNNKECVNRCLAVLTEISPSGVRDEVTQMIGEDFAYLTDRRPGAFICMGTKSEAKHQEIHSPNFDIDERSMMIGSSFFVELVHSLLAKPST